MPIFTPPTVDEGPVAGDRLFARFKIQRGVTVLKNGTTYTQHRFPSLDEVLAADIAYIGGHQYVIDRAEAVALEAAGYANYLAPAAPGEYDSHYRATY